MTIQKIVFNEDERSIQCYRKKAFWTAYEKSAYRLCQLGEHKPIVRYNKYLKRHIVSIRFAQDVVEKMLVEFSEEYQREINEFYIKISGGYFPDTEDFEIWKENLIAESKIILDAYGFLHGLVMLYKKDKM